MNILDSSSNPAFSELREIRWNDFKIFKFSIYVRKEVYIAAPLAFKNTVKFDGNVTEYKKLQTSQILRTQKLKSD